MVRWRRPYPIDVHEGMAALVFAFVGVVAVGVAVGLVRGTVEWHAWHALFIPVLAYAGRSYLLGLYVSDRGIRIRWFWTTHSWRWESITGFDDRRATHGGRPSLHWHAIWMLLRDGTAIETPLWRITRRELWYPSLYSGRHALLEPAYSSVLRTLRERLRQVS